MCYQAGTIGWLNIKAAATYAGISVRTMRSWLKQGLRYSRLRSGHILIKKEEIDKFLECFEVTDVDSVGQIVEGIYSELNQRN